MYTRRTLRTLWKPADDSSSIGEPSTRNSRLMLATVAGSDAAACSPTPCASTRMAGSATMTAFSPLVPSRTPMLDSMVQFCMATRLARPACTVPPCAPVTTSLSFLLPTKRVRSMSTEVTLLVPGVPPTWIAEATPVRERL